MITKKPTHGPDEGASQGPEKASRVVKKVKNKAHTIESEGALLERIQGLIDNPNNRELQKRAYIDFLESLKAGKRSGIFKMPTGSGKTQTYANMIQVLGKNGLTLIPRVDLYPSNLRDFKAVGYQDYEILFPHEESGVNSADRFLAMLKNPQNDWKSGRVQCIMTYQSLVSMCKQKPEIGELIREHFGVIIQDEAHRGLGESTKAITTTLSDDEDTPTEKDPEEQEIEDEEDTADKILGHMSNRYEYKFTATPDLLGKSVADDSDYIHYSTFEDAVRTGAIVLPQYTSVGKAYLRDTDLTKWTVSGIEELSEHDSFVDETGVSIRDKIISEYKIKKELHGELPAVAFAATIKHAKNIVDELRKSGICAIRVTSEKSDVSSITATKLMDEGKLDVIVTVTKVSEGFDYPRLACAMWFTPALSPAKILQGNGRITRDLDYKRPATILDENGKLLPSPNTYIIAPEAWFGGRKNTGGGRDFEDDGDQEPGGYGESTDDENPEGTKKKKRPAPGIGNFYELLINQREIDINALGEGMRGIVDIERSIECEPGQEIVIDDIIHIGVTHSKEVLGIQGPTIFNHAIKLGEKIIQAHQSNGLSVQLVKKVFIEQLKNKIPVYECDPGEKIEIDGVVFVGVTKSVKIDGIPGEYIFRKYRESGEETITVRRKTMKGTNIQLVKKAFIEQLDYEIPDYECDPGEKIEIDDVMHFGVTRSVKIFGIPGEYIFRKYRESGEETITARRKTMKGPNIQLVKKDFILSLQKK